MKMNEVLISHEFFESLSRRSAMREADAKADTRYYNGVPCSRTPISCVVAAFFIAALVPSAAESITFPLEAKWSATLPAPPAFPPAFDANRVYVALKTKQLVALLIKDGTSSWSVECPMSAPPAAGGGLVYTGTDDLIEARAESDGRAQWRRPVKGRVVSLHWDAGWLFAQTEPGPLLAIRASDGEVLWQKDFGSVLSAGALPAAAGDRLYVPLQDGRVIAMALQTGDDMWTHKLKEPAAGILPVGDRVFVGSRDNHFYSLAAENADGDWRFPTGADVLGLPVLDTRRVYFIALDNILRGHNRNSGSMDWKRVLPVRPFTGPLLSGDTLIVSGIAAQLYGYSTRDGKNAGSHEVKGAEGEEMLLAAPPHLTALDSLILVTKGGNVRAVGSSSKPIETSPATPAPAESPTQDTPPADPEPDAVGAAIPTP
jgi:outer membrane protein assembly factor BamB